MELNPTIVFTSPKVVEIEERAKPVPKEGQVLIKTSKTLISTGTELTILGADYPPGSVWESYGRLPFDPGYDNVGIVIETGAGVDRNVIGRRVGSWGNHARYVACNANELRFADQKITDEEVAFFAIAEIVMNGIRRARLNWGEAVVVYGMGLLGQFTVQFCRVGGARPIVAVDVSERRLALLPKTFAVIPVNSGKNDVVVAVKEATRGRMADVVFEVTGSAQLIPREFEALHNQGRFVLLSSPHGKTSFDFHDLCNRPSHTIIGAHNWSHPAQGTPDYPWTMLRHSELFFDLTAEKALDATSLITHRAHYSEAPRLYKMLLQDRTNALGVILDWNEK